MTNHVDGMLEHSGRLQESRRAFGVETAAPWQRVVEEMAQEYYPKKSRKFVQNMFAGSIRSVIRELGEENATQIAHDIETFWKKRETFLDNKPTLRLGPELTGGEEEWISERENFNRLSLKDKLRWAAMTGGEYRLTQEELKKREVARKHAELKMVVAGAAVPVVKEGPAAPLEELVTAVQTLPEKSAKQKLGDAWKDVKERAGEWWEETKWRWRVAQMKVPEGAPKRPERLTRKQKVAWGLAATAFIGVGVYMLLHPGRSSAADFAALADTQDGRVALAAGKARDTVTARPRATATTAAPTETARPATPTMEAPVPPEVKFEVGGVIDLGQKFDLVVPAETAKIIGVKNQLRLHIDPVVDTDETWNPGLQAKLGDYKSYPDLGYVTRTHVGEVEAIGIHGGTPGGKPLNGEVFATADNPGVYEGARIDGEQNGHQVQFEVVAVRDVPTKVFNDKENGAFAEGSEDGIPSVFMRLDAVGLERDLQNKVDLVLYTCDDLQGTEFETRRVVFLRVRIVDGVPVGLTAEQTSNEMGSNPLLAETEEIVNMINQYPAENPQDAVKQTLGEFLKTHRYGWYERKVEMLSPEQKDVLDRVLRMLDNQTYQYDTNNDGLRDVIQCAEFIRLLSALGYAGSPDNLAGDAFVNVVDEVPADAREVSGDARVAMLNQFGREVRWGVGPEEVRGGMAFLRDDTVKEGHVGAVLSVERTIDGGYSVWIAQANGDGNGLASITHQIVYSEDALRGLIGPKSIVVVNR